MTKMSKPKTERPEHLDEVQLAHRMVNAFVEKHEVPAPQGHDVDTPQEQPPTAAPKKGR